MPHSPRRPGAWALAAFLALGLAAFVPPGGVPGHAGQADGHLQGLIPNSPPYLAIPFPLTTDYRPQEGALLAADLDADGRVELIVSVPSGVLTVIRSDGSTAPGWPRTFAERTQPAFPFGAPAVGDLDGDGSPEIVTCVISGSAPRKNLLYAIRADGTDFDPGPTDHFKPPPWPVEVQHEGADYYSCSPSGALVADLDGDGAMEVVRAMSRGEIVAFDGDGSPHDGWPVRLGTDDLGRLKEVNADLAAADLDGDGDDEVVFVEAGFAPRLAAVSGAGTLLQGFPIGLPEVTDRQAPVLVDLNKDGRPEIVQSTLPFSGDVLYDSPESEPQTGEPLVPAALHVIVMRADGEPVPGWSRQLQSGGVWGAVIADLDGDTFPEIFQEDGDALLGFDAAGTLLPGFPLTIHRDFVRSQSLRVSPWVTGDVDGDAAPDFVQARSNVYNGSAYLRLMGLRATGQSLKGFPFDAEGRLAASRPVLADLSSDGTVDLALLTKDGPNGRWILVVWDLGALLRGNQAP